MSAKSRTENNKILGKYDVIVVGSGHAGCEAGLACARMGLMTLMLATNLETVGMMPCNPAIGGTGKGHLVREIDALGGEMGINTDKTFIQSKVLNRSKGAAVHSLRAQADKNLYHVEMKKTLEAQEDLYLKQAEAVELLLDNVPGEKPRIAGVKTATNGIYEAGSVILATGTFLGGKVFIGDSVTESGPNGMAPAKRLAANLKELGLPLRRFKTGTPARALASSLDFSKMEEQTGDERIVPFSFLNDSIEKDQVMCHLTYTNEDTHQIIRDNFHRSALFGGQIEGVGPRYCPSIEDKVRRFADRKRHQLFVEPEGLDTEEMYIQGMSTSLPEDVQQDFYKTIPGLENIEIVRPGYAIEYDCIDPTSLRATLEYKHIDNLFCAGQINGSSGYEEAAAQGLIAGINCALKHKGEEPFVLGRDEAYIGVLIDDLTLKGTNEPYRIMTSRAEYRILLRQDNADVRLTEKSYRIGLATQERYDKFLAKRKKVLREIERLETTELKSSEVNDVLYKRGLSPVKNRISLAGLLRRSKIDYRELEEIDKNRPELTDHEIDQAQVKIKYEGYIGKQLAQIEKFRKLEGKTLPEGLDYSEIGGLRNEAVQKLGEMRPETVGKASRISGVSPADINVLLVYLEKISRNN
jgi:tRNA uridine 5-carboxymethylaminomethyl modification enzyme